MGKVLPFAAVRSVLADGYANLMSRLGTSGDRNAHGIYVTPVISQQQLEAAYRSSWLTRKIHDLPAFEMTRAGRRWQATKEQIEPLEALETRLGIWLKVRIAISTARLHGGAAMVLGVRQGMPDQPLNPETLGKNTLRYVVVVSRHQLYAPQGFDTDPESEFFMQPAMWQMRGQRGNSVDIHPSRVIPFHGAPLPPGAMAISQLDQFWGDPLLLSINAAINNAEVSQAAIATLLHEMKQDVISIPGLTEQIATENHEAILAARIEAINRFKSMFNALLLDAGDDEGKGGEKWETRQLSFAQMPELMREFVGLVAGAADIPVTRLLGQSPGGMQSTGKGEQNDFNRMIEARRDADLAGPLARLDDVLVRSALGSRPAEIYYEFGDLEPTDPTTDSENEKREAETVDIYARTGLVPQDALAKAAVNRLIESGRWPGLEQAIEESDEEPGEQDDDEEQLRLPAPANENDVQEMERRGTVNRDQAMVLLADASPRSLYVRRDLENVAEFTAWAREQGFSDLPDDLHVTVVYSRTPIDWMKAGADTLWASDDKGMLTVPPGGPRLVERFDNGAIVLEFTSSALTYRHQDIRRAGAEHGHEEYRPHVTFAKGLPEGKTLRDLEPYRGKLVFGPEVFEEVKDDLHVPPMVAR